jgi:hypothetical protein
MSFLMPSRPLTLPEYASEHFTVETEWQATPRPRARSSRVVQARYDSSVPHFDAGALTAALRLDAMPLFQGRVRKIRGSFGP